MATRNLSKEKRERLISKIEEIKATANDETIAVLNELENELSRKKYGLVWEEHSEEVEEEMLTKIPVFTEAVDKEIVSSDDKNFNFILEGDNLHSLRLLGKTHAGKIDIIYIDPPYNTGNRDFVYEDSMIGKDDGYRHSKWLSFMYSRLIIARKLLSDTGVIYISIDDNEISNLRLLCDQIFGEENFINQITLLCNPKGRSQDKYFATCHEYLLVYSKRELPKGSLSVEKTDEKIEKEYKLIDAGGRYRLLELRNTHREFDRSNRPNLYFPLYVCPDMPEGSDVSLQPDSKHTVEVLPIWPDGHDGCWTWGKALVDSDINLLVGQKKRGKWKIYRKSYAVSDAGHVVKRKLFSIWKEPEFYTEKGQVEFGRIFLGSSKNDFPQPKAVEYIKTIIRTRPNTSTVLDFFAGSGTTAQAVLELNKEDSGSRKFILCTNNENSICEEVTYPRIRTVITGKRLDGSEYSKGIPANLKYYKTSFVNKRRDGSVPKALLKHVKELIQLEMHCKIDNKTVCLAFTEEELDFIIDKKVKQCEKIYIASDVLLTAKQIQIVADNNIELIDIPEYYFSEELREVDEV